MVSGELLAESLKTKSNFNAVMCDGAQQRGFFKPFFLFFGWDGY
jgi:hypothetical protein